MRGEVHAGSGRGQQDQPPCSARPRPAAPGIHHFVVTRPAFQERVVPGPPRRKAITKKVKTACLASGSNLRRRAKGIQRPDVSKPQVRLSGGALRVTSAGDVLPRRQGAGLGRTLKDPQPCSLCLGFLPRFSDARGLKTQQKSPHKTHQRRPGCVLGARLEPPGRCAPIGLAIRGKWPRRWRVIWWRSQSPSPPPYSDPALMSHPRLGGSAAGPH
ncbi:unnamed protein product [Rangifer tarandus platyrhynchus]|uniref:Uncharacterized protein n=1 Tax=Rangifer tarandus platyrhynchus TaxID=3082113 RepID=A0AC59Z2D0_RANTA